MDSPNFSRIQQIFEQALDLEPADRAAFLDEACGDDAELRARVEELLAADAELDEFLEPPQGFGLPVDKLRAEAKDFLPEEEIGGYQLLRELGRGGRGVVYLAREPETGALVALKVLGSGLLPSAVAVERFRREAKANARVDHPSIVKLRLSGDDTGRPFLVMDYIGGHTLADEILLQRSQSEAIELPEHLQGRAPVLPTEERARLEASVRLVQQMAEALHHAHERGVLHRDVKPQNVLLDEDGRPHLIDFGLADVQGEMSLTRTGEVEGTPNYMSPEQVRALKGGIDLRTDVYSLGVVLYELLTLRRPFDAPTVNQVMQNITRTMPPRIRRVVPSVPTTFELICTTAIEKRPEHRYPSMAIFASDLDAFLQSRPLQAKAPSPLTRVMRRVRRRPMPYAVGLAVVVALVLGLGAGEAVARWSAMRELRSLLAAVDAKSGFDPNREYAPVLQAADAAVDRGWTVPKGTQATVDTLRQGMSQHLQDELGAFELPRLAGALFDAHALMAGEIDLRNPESYVAERQAQWASWGVEPSVQAAMRNEILQGGLVIEFDPAEAADGAQIELFAMEFVRANEGGAETQRRQFLPGYALEPGRTYRGEVRYESGEVQEFTVLPVASGEARRLVLRPQAQLPDLVRFPAFELNGFDQEGVSKEFYFFLEGSSGAEFALADRYVSVGDFRDFALSTGAELKLFEAFLPAALDDEVLRQPAIGWTPCEAAAYCAWAGCRLPWLDELVAAFGPFEADGRPSSVAAADFAAWQAALAVHPSAPEFGEPAARQGFRDLLVSQYPAADQSGALGAHPSGVIAWLIGLSELTGSPAMTRRMAALGAEEPPMVSALQSGLSSRGVYRPAGKIGGALREGIETGIAFRCARSVRNLR